MAWHSLAQLGAAWHNLAQLGTAWHSLAQPGTAWRHKQGYVLICLLDKVFYFNGTARFLLFH